MTLLVRQKLQSRTLAIFPHGFRKLAWMKGLSSHVAK